MSDGLCQVTPEEVGAGILSYLKKVGLVVVWCLFSLRASGCGRVHRAASQEGEETFGRSGQSMNKAANRRLSPSQHTSTILSVKLRGMQAGYGRAACDETCLDGVCRSLVLRSRGSSTRFALSMRSLSLCDKTRKPTAAALAFGVLDSHSMGTKNLLVDCC